MLLFSHFSLRYLSISFPIFTSIHIFINPVDMHKEQSLLFFSLSANFTVETTTEKKTSSSLFRTVAGNIQILCICIYIYQVSFIVVHNRCSLNVSFLVHSFKSLDLSAGHHITRRSIMFSRCATQEHVSCVHLSG